MENNYQLSRIHNYVNGLMSREEMHTLEREALDDPFLQDAIDGYKLQEGVDVKQLSLLQQRLSTRVNENVSLKNKRFYSWQRLAIGMTAGVLFVTVCTLLLIRYLPQQKSSLTEVEIMQDQVYSIALGNTGKYDGEPVNGWESFENYLTHSYLGKNHKEAEILVYFKIDQGGRPYQILVNNGESPLDSYQEIVELLKNGPKWRGTEGEVLIDVHLLDM
ncbi:hypothetical protein SAMN05660841_02136 [Sphingobacterium nematocida]|uniref:Uncharacterized protein n=1 Tax=Sphingobacterium nematocida TaxID=1513896 RepID=A0A1T5DSE9_9SPHI|nr:hypothetical protein [Sphingobacterium nematocida]SKB74591.1 hypothetical protein SAMN05660841_02136 [Sphingobacterium nematocida]